MSKILVHLHGYLAKFHDGPISVVVATAAEAIELVTRQLKGFAPDIRRGPHKITVVGHPTAEDLYKPIEVQDLHILPQFVGGKNGGFYQIAIGAALIAASFIPGLNALVAPVLFSLGASLLLGGISQLLFPVPDSEDSKNKSRYLGAPKNTVEIGTRIPILYGRHQVYGHVLSFDIQSLNKSVSS